MALGTSEIDLLIRLRKDGAFGPGAVMEIGAQQLSNSFLRHGEELAELGRLFGVDAPFDVTPRGEPRIAYGNRELLPADAPRSRSFWEWLGFRYASIDIDSSPGALPLDLNFDEAPVSARGRFDLIVNAGTTEHVANQVNAFKVMHDLAAVGCIMIHDLPAQGMLNHGLVNYNPKFFWNLAKSNEYQILFFDFRSDGIAYELPDNIDSWTLKFNPSRKPTQTFTDCSILVAMRKRFDIPYVAPLDIDNGATAPNPEIGRRYWTVFEEGVWDRIEAEHEILLAARRAAAKPAAIAEATADERIPSRLNDLRDGLRQAASALAPRLGLWRAFKSLVG